MVRAKGLDGLMRRVCAGGFIALSLVAGANLCGGEELPMLPPPPLAASAGSPENQASDAAKAVIPALPVAANEKTGADAPPVGEIRGESPYDGREYVFRDGYSSDRGGNWLQMSVAIGRGHTRTIERLALFNLQHYPPTLQFVPGRCILHGWATMDTAEILLIDAPQMRVAASFLSNGASLSPSGKYLLCRKVIPHFSDPGVRNDMYFAVRADACSLKEGTGGNARSVGSNPSQKTEAAEHVKYPPEDEPPVTVLYPPKNAQKQDLALNDFCDDLNKRHRYLGMTVWAEDGDIACLAELYDRELYVVAFDFRTGGKVRVTSCPLGFSESVHQQQMAMPDESLEHVVREAPLALSVKNEVVRYEYAPDLSREDDEAAMMQKIRVKNLRLADFPSYEVPLR